MTALLENSRRFQALADPTRLRILSLLAERELCVCRLVDVLAEPQPKISRHLALLRRAGLVTVRTEGPWRHYALAPARRGLTARLLGCVRTGLSDVEELQADRRRLAALGAGPACEAGR